MKTERLAESTFVSSRVCGEFGDDPRVVAAASQKELLEAQKRVQTHVPGDGTTGNFNEDDPRSRAALANQ